MDKPIDLDSLIASKNPKLARKMPRFVKAYLNRILHLNEINQFLLSHKEVNGFEFADAGMDFIGLKTRVVGEENLIGVNRPLLVANHPLGGLEGIALLQMMGRSYGNVKLLVNDFLMALHNLEELFIPVNKHGSSRRYKKNLDEAVAGDDPLIIFPAGVCSRRVSYGIYDLEWNKSFVKMARSAGRPVVPVHVGGQNSRFFYALANLRKRLGINGNIEMLYLVDEMFKQRGATLDIVIGRPVPSETFDNRYDDWLWAKRMRQHIYELKGTSGDSIPEFDPDERLRLPETYYA